MVTCARLLFTSAPIVATDIRRSLHWVITELPDTLFPVVLYASYLSILYI